MKGRFKRRQRARAEGGQAVGEGETRTAAGCVGVADDKRVGASGHDVFAMDGLRVEERVC
jgi:hypothetical protein